MFPSLLELHFGSRQIGIHSYGLCIAAGVAVAVVWFVRRAKRAGLPGQRAVDLAFWTLVLGLAGARLAYVLVDAPYFVRACLDLGRCARVLYFWEGGLVFQGGLVAGAATVWLFSRRQGWRTPQVADLLAPAVAVGHAFGRLGCFAAGCCFGKESHVPWAVSFPRDSVAFIDLRSNDAVSPFARGTPPLQPTQLYEMAGELVIAATLILLGRRRPRRDGTLTLAYAAMYGGLRFVVEIFRGDGDRGFVVQWLTPGLARALGLPAAEPLFLSVPQLVALALVTAGLWGLSRQHRQIPSPRPERGDGT